MKTNHRAERIPCRRRGQLAVAVAIALCATATGAAWAQDAAAAATQEKQATAALDAKDLDTVIVTGSRIRREPGFEGPAPVTAISAEKIQASGYTQIADMVNQLPSFAVTQSSQTANQTGNVGVSALDLRGMGVQRTLTLVDGRRQVASIPGTAGVDVSALPASMIERVDVVTGGASALYGADAVNGVVNFILKRDYEGLEASVRYADSSRGDMPTYTGDVLFGKNFADNRGNFTLYGFWEENSGTVRGQDRPWTANGYPYYARAKSTDPYTILDNSRNVYNSPNATVSLGNCSSANAANCLYTFNPDGSLRHSQLGPGGLTNLSTDFNVLQQGTTDGGEFGGRYDSWYLVTPSDRQTVRSTLDFDVTDSLRLVGTVNYSQSQSEASWRSLSTYGSGGSEVVPYYSPFITQEMIDANGGAFTKGIAFGRHFDEELGHMRQQTDRKLLQATVGMEGYFDFIGRSWNYEAYYSYGRSRQRTRELNAASYDRLISGLDSYVDAAGNPICWNGPAGCVAINPFKRLTSDMVDWLTYDTDWSSTTLTQKVASAYVSGGLFDLPGGEAKIVVGSEYRKERNEIGTIAQYDPSNAAYDPTLGVTQTGLNGEFSVKEIFSELSLPLLSDVAGAKRLSLELAGRISDYSTAGRTTTTKLGLEWAPIEDITLRGTYGKAIRAPNIGELFTAGTISSAWIYDPCNDWALANRSDTTDFTAANCAAISPSDTSVNNYWQWKDIVYSGNKNLKPETAKTTTFGVVLRPRFASNLTVSADYYKIDLRGVISTLNYQTILNYCVDQSSLDNTFCDAVTRDQNGDIVEVAVQQLNLSQSIARGVDINANWYYDLGETADSNAGRIILDLSYGRTLQRQFVADPQNPDDVWDYLTRWGTPKWKGTVRTGWSNPKMSFYWTLRHVSKMRASNSSTSTYEREWAGNTFYSDFYASYQFTPKVSIFGGLNNAFDRAPPRVPGAEAGGAGFNQSGSQAAVYDVLGRTFNLGVRVKL